jgi:hypothetical protein
MRKILLATAAAAFALSGAVLAAPASAEPPKGDPGAVSPMHAPCGTPGPNLENRVEADAPASGAVNQRSGTIAASSTNCVIVGVLQPTDDARYFCFTLGNDGFTWTYLQNQRTGVRGWSRDNLLDLNPDGTRGSIRYCGF